MNEMIVERKKQSRADIKDNRLTVYQGGKNKYKKSRFGSFGEEYELEDIPHTFFDKVARRTLNSDEIYSAVDHYFNVQMSTDVSKNPKAHKTSSNGGGGGNGMEQRIERLERKTDQIQTDLNSIAKSIAVMEEAQKNVATKSDIYDIKNEILHAIQKIPSNDNIKQIIMNSNNEQKIATQEFVNSELNKFSNAQIKWIIGTAIAAVAAVAGIIKIFL